MVSQEFYFIDCGGVHPVAPIEDEPDVDGDWTSGEALELTIQEPLEYTLGLKDIFDADIEEREDMDLASYGPDDFNVTPFMTSINPPLMRHDLLGILKEVGVDNLELFQAIIRNPLTGNDYENFSAFNIVGVADFEWARDLRREISQREYRIKTPPFLMFYLYEDGPIVVHDSVRLAIEKANIEGMWFVPTYEGY